MHRSGTSLAEQILSSHASVFGAGEVAFWDKADPRNGQLAQHYLNLQVPLLANFPPPPGGFPE